MRILSAFNYDRKTQTFLYAPKNGRTQTKTCAAHFLLSTGRGEDDARQLVERFANLSAKRDLVIAEFVYFGFENYDIF